MNFSPYTYTGHYKYKIAAQYLEHWRTKTTLSDNQCEFNCYKDWLITGLSNYRIIILISLLFQRQGRVKLMLEEVWQLIIIIMALILLFYKLMNLYPGRRVSFLKH